ncbi:hypothetical protein [Sanguibacter antarcticus]|uniref:Uncharacterized protein n=1 Tax=Sanguibacter antarcticus TaxID=372484 RepID=A0A2A9E2Y0_9MICO|nr:hypothetical protein [Sanguibacter antarcticus]PFG32559.1 hypothetical protein ATL42_0399 [Sanguibacter antarcticus]
MRHTPDGSTRRARRNRNIAIFVVLAMVLVAGAPALAFLLG